MFSTTANKTPSSPAPPQKAAGNGFFHKIISQVAHLVTGKLHEAKTAITTGKKAIDEYVKKLPRDLQDVGREAADSIQDKFDSLEQSVNDRRDQMIEGLAKKYVDNVKQLDERISDMKEANKGLVDKAIGLLKKVYQVIKDLTTLFLSIFSKLARIIGVVLGDPGGLFGNIGKAFSVGFANFKKNFTGYLEQGLMSWLMTNLGVAGVELPKRFDAGSLFGFALQVLGITKTHIRERAVVVIGERKVAMLEAGGELLARVYSEGVGVIWEMISEKISDFKEIVWEAIKSFIQTKVVEAALTFILSMLNPIGAFVKVCMAIYDFLMMLVRFKYRITELLDTILNAVISIASGAVDSAAKAIEGAFAKSIPVIIGFLAALLHLNDIAAKVRDIITRIRARVEKGIDWVLNKAVTLVKGAGRTVAGAGRSVAAAVRSGWGALLGFKKGFTAGQASHTLYFAGNDSKVSLMVATTPKELPEAISDREREIRAKIAVLQNRSSKNAAAEIKKQDHFLLRLKEAETSHAEIEQKKAQIAKEKDEAGRAKLQDAKLDVLNYADGKAPPFRRAWNSYEGEANKVLNHRAHHFQQNPAGYQWEHLVEQASSFSSQVVNSVENMYLAKQTDNHNLGRIFGEFDKAREYLPHGSDAAYLDELISNNYLSPRQYLRSKNIDEHRKWKLHFYKKLGIAPVTSDKNIDNRGPFRTMDNATI